MDHELDLSIFIPRYKNDFVGAPAYDPLILLKIILYAYSRGITGSRRIEEACRNNVIFMALSAHTVPHFTTIADFISSMDKEIIALFRNVLLICDEMGLIGKEMFAVDGCKLSSNASKEWSGTKEELTRKKEKFEKAIEYIVKKHRSEDKAPLSPLPQGEGQGEGGSSSDKTREEQAILNLRVKAEKIKRWLSEHEDKPGKSGKIKKSNITDNESAKLVTSHGVVQGYNGVVASDAKHQVIVYAEAFGEASEHEVLKPMIDGTRENFKEMGKEGDPYKEAQLTADSGFHTEANMKMLLEEEQIDAYVADNRYRKRDPRFATAKQNHPPFQKKVRKYFAPSDFKQDETRGKAICPAGKEMYLKNSNFEVRGLKGISYMGRESDCRECPMRAQCLRNPNTKARQVTFFTGKTQEAKESFTQKMIQRIDSVKGRLIYSRRMGVVEPVFANIRSTLGLHRFRLRGKVKVNTQWRLFCLVHNLGKIYRYGLQAA